MQICKKSQCISMQRHMAEFIGSTFSNFCPSVSFGEWCVCQVANNTSTNRQLASLLHIKHIGCESHQFNLNIKCMLKEDKAAINIIDTIHKTMLDVKNRLTNNASLHNTTNFHSIIPNETRWSGKYNMVACHVKLYGQIMEAANDEHAFITANECLASKIRATKLCNMLSESNAITKFLQKRQGRRRMLDNKHQPL